MTRPPLPEQGDPEPWGEELNAHIEALGVDVDSKAPKTALTNTNARVSGLESKTDELDERLTAVEGGGGGGGGGGVSDHGLLSGLTDDDHTQYFNQARGDARYELKGQGGGGGATAHGDLTGLDADDHPQYLTEARGDTRYALQGQGGTGVTDHGLLTGLSDNDHPQYQLTSQKGQASGYASLGSDGKVPSGQLPASTGGTSTSRYVPVVIINGESNSGGYADNGQALASELLPRPAVQIFDNIGLASYLDLDIGTNNLVDHAGLSNGPTHGLELALANSVEAGQWWDDKVYLIKTGQGGSKISDWNVGSSYYTKFLDRTRNGLGLLRAQGKIPVIYFWYSLGINDAIAGTNEATWKQAVKDYFTRIRKEIGYVPIFSTQFMASSPGVAFNDSVIAMGTEDNMLYAIDAAGTTTRDANHWDYAGMKLMGQRIIAATLDFGQHDAYLMRSVSMLAGGTAMVVSGDKPDLVRTPATVSFIEGSAGGTFTVALSKAPVANVVVSVAASGGNVSALPTTLTFTSGNWSTAQTVTCTSPDDAGQNGSRTSTVTLSSTGVTAPATVGVTVTDAFVNPGPVNTALPAITGATTLGAVLTCSQGTWTGSPTGYAYQWNRDALPISGQTSNTHTIVVADQGHVLTCTVTATNAQGSNPATSANCNVPADAGSYTVLTWKNQTAATVNGADQVVAAGGMPAGANAVQTIDATQPFAVKWEFPTGNDANGVVCHLEDTLDYTNFSWGAAQVYVAGYYATGTAGNQAYTAVNGSANTPITGWTPTYPIQIKAEKSGNDIVWSSSPDGLVWTTRATQAGVLAGKTTIQPRVLYAVAVAGQKVKGLYDIVTGTTPTAPVNTVLPAISGPTVVGGVLTASTGTWTQSPTAYTYQWKKDGADIVGQTTNQYTIVAGDQQHDLSCTVTASNAQGSTSATSANTNIPLPSAPANTVLPAITGSTSLGAVLTSSSGTWTGSPTGYTYQWKRDGSNIAGETVATHTIVSADQGKSLTCAVTATNPQGSTTATSAATAIPAPSTLVPYSYQNLTNATEDGSHWIVASGGGNTGGNAIGPVDVTQPFSIVIDWLSNAASTAVVVMLDDTMDTAFNWTGTQLYTTGCYNTSGGACYSGINSTTPISWGYTTSFPAKCKMEKSGNDVVYSTSPDGVTWTPRYTHTGVLSGKTIQYVRVIFATASAGQKVLVQYDSALLPPAAPVNTVLPTITGNTDLASVLTCSPGSWTGVPTGYTYQWKRDGVNIGGETATTHTIIAADQGTSLTCAVTATNANGSTSATSAACPIPAAGMTLNPVVWGTRSASVSDGGGGRVNLTSAVGTQGALADGTIDLTKAFEVEVAYTSTGETNGVVVYVDDDNTQNWTWNGANDFLIGTYQYNAAGQSAKDGATVVNIGTTYTYPVKIKMAKSGDDIVFYRADGAGAYGSVFYTEPGVLAGKTTGYLKCLFAVPGAGQYVVVKLAKAP